MRWLNADRALAWGVAAAIAVVVFPLPTPLLDGLLAAQLGLSIVVLVAALGVRDPLDLSSFPAVLLLTTLLRLALNVSTTRLILGQADAGDVVAAFGDVVVAGNVLVGLVVFGVLTLVQFLV
ncbi:MAG: FHIPEP family type III secretion protein, partial [Myxococcales bacterium]|nr:FHIPEP family type III secretion protein [Myxococcales bacterium]